MYKVFLVDDEIVIREGIRNSFPLSLIHISSSLRRSGHSRFVKKWFPALAV